MKAMSRWVWDADIPGVVRQAVDGKLPRDEVYAAVG